MKPPTNAFSMKRRIKVCTESPLPPVKAWYPLRPSIDTIYQLKYGLTHDLAALASNNYKRGDIKLQVEGFDLFDGSSIEILDLEKDVLTIKLKLESSAVVGKRSADDLASKRDKKRKVGPTGSASRDVFSIQEESEKPSIHKKQKKTDSSANASRKSGPQPPTEKVTVLRSASTQSSSSSKDSESSTSSTSFAESSSSSENLDSDVLTTGSSVQPKKVARSHDPDQSKNTSGTLPLQKMAPALVKALPPSTPPGQGKKSTRDRNQRRRANRKSVRAASTVTRSIPEAVSSPTIVSLPITNPSPAVAPLAIAVPKAMANKNKRKGFRQAMDGVTGTRTVYPDIQEDVSVTRNHDSMNEAEYNSIESGPVSVSSTQNPRGTPTKSSRITRAPDNTLRLPPLPPSRMTSLAPNIIITSQWFQTPSRQEDIKQLRRESKRVSDHPPVAEAMPLIDQKSSTVPTPVWDALALSHTKLDAVDESGFKGLSTGSILAWEGLELNEMTWQPEVRLSLGRVQLVDGNSITLELLKRPVEASEEDQISEEIDARSALDEPEGLPTVITLTNQDVCQGSYRVVQ